jgi:hypothetical protein
MTSYTLICILTTTTTTTTTINGCAQTTRDENREGGLIDKRRKSKARCEMASRTNCVNKDVYTEGPAQTYINTNYEVTQQHRARGKGTPVKHA